tara:strand:+ start:233 stop:478 length:246 start_codon:yes stop_codon:yes gene_type:complete
MEVLDQVIMELLVEEELVAKVKQVVLHLVILKMDKEATDYLQVYLDHHKVMQEEAEEVVMHLLMVKQEAMVEEAMEVELRL